MSGRICCWNKGDSQKPTSKLQPVGKMICELLALRHLYHLLRVFRRSLLPPDVVSSQRGGGRWRHWYKECPPSFVVGCPEHQRRARCLRAGRRQRRSRSEVSSSQRARRHPVAHSVPGWRHDYRTRQLYGSASRRTRPSSQARRTITPRSTQPSTLRGTIKWVPAKGRWCSAAGE